MDERNSEAAAEQPGPESGPFFDLSFDPMAIISRGETGWLRINPAFEQLLGWREEELNGKPAAALVRDEDQLLFGQAISNASVTAANVNLHLRKATGGYQAMAWRFVPASTEHLLLAVGRPLPDREQGLEARVRRLTSEIEHRVRNNLAVLRSIIRRTAKSSSGTEAFAHLQGRIDAFARIQSKLRLAGHEYRGVDLALLIEDELLAQSVREGPQLTIDGPDIALSPKAAEAIGLAVHELAVNAVKFGAFAVQDAAVTVRWEVEGEDKLLLAWHESGAAPDAAPVRGDGFGMETLLRSLPYDLGAETGIEFAADGIRFALSVPLEGIVAPPA